MYNIYNELFKYYIFIVVAIYFNCNNNSRLIRELNKFY